MITKIALITGGNRGLGLEVCQQLGRMGFHIILGARSTSKCQKAAIFLKRKVLNILVTPVVIDATDLNSIEMLFKFILDKFGKLDILINNAGVYLDNHINGDYPDIFNLDLIILEKTLKVNTFGPFILMQKL